MSKTIIDLINNKNSKGFWYYWRILWKQFWLNFKTKDTKIDKSWVKLKINHSFVPKEWDKNNPYGSVAESYKEFKMFKR